MMWTYFYGFRGQFELCLIIDVLEHSSRDRYGRLVQMLRPNGEVLWRDRTLSEIYENPFIFEP